MKTRSPSSSIRSTISTSKPSHEAIAARAKILWERRGRPEGRDEEIWFEAERHVSDQALAKADDARFANRGSLLNEDSEPNDDVDDRLNAIVSRDSRSATSL